MLESKQNWGAGVEFWKEMSVNNNEDIQNKYLTRVWAHKELTRRVDADPRILAKARLNKKKCCKKKAKQDFPYPLMNSLIYLTCRK